MDVVGMSTIILIRHIVISHDKQAQEELCQRIINQGILERTFKNKKRSRDFEDRILFYEDFAAYFWFSLLTTRKLESLLCKFEIECSENRMNDEEKFAFGYLVKIAKTVFEDLVTETRGKWEIHRQQKLPYSVDRGDGDTGMLEPEDLSSTPGKEVIDYVISRESQTSIDIEELESLILNLPQKARIPMWLKYLVRISSLIEDDIQYLADINQCSEERILELIDIEVNHNIDSEKSTGYVSTAFLASIMHMSTNTLDQRIRRVKDKIVFSLSSESEQS